MPKKTSVPINVGPMWTRGDLLKAPKGTSFKARNVAFRRGVVEKRPGFLYESDASAPTNISQLHKYDSGSGVVLYGGDINASDGEYRNSNGTWTAATGSGLNIKGAVDYENVLYILGGEDATRQSRVDSLTTTTVATWATKTRVGGQCVGTYGGRLLIGSPKFYHSNGGAFKFAFNSGAEWTVSGSWSQPTGTTLRTATIVDGAADAIKSTAAVYTTGSAEEYVTFVFELKNTDADNELPVTVTVENSAGTTVYKTVEFNVPTASIEGDWQKYSYSELFPASTALFVKLKMGNQTGSCSTSVFYISDSDNNHGFSVYPGRFVYPYGAQATVAAISGAEYLSRWYWSEALDFTDWRNTNYAEVDEVSGAITAITSVNGRVVVFKKNAMWVYRPGPSFEVPFIRESFFPDVGCLGPTAIAEFDNVLYFVGENEVYAFDGGSKPEPLCGIGMKEEIFNTQLSSGVVAVDTDNREVWVYARTFRIYLYSVDDKQWIGYYQLTDSNGSESPFTPNGVIKGMVYMQPQGESNREMWLTFTTATNTTTIAKLRAAQTQDNLDGTARDIVAEYAFQPLETERWRQQLTLQYMGIDHKITATQTGSTTEYSVSLDGGNTWAKYNQVRPPLSSGGVADTDPIRIPLFQTSPRLVFKIKHTGLGGPTYFNMTGGELMLLARGPEIQGTNPTQVGSSL